VISRGLPGDEREIRQEGGGGGAEGETWFKVKHMGETWKRATNEQPGRTGVGEELKQWRSGGYWQQCLCGGCCCC